MERRWLTPLLIGGGAVLLVALFVIFGGGSKTPEALDAAPLDDASTPIDTSAPAWMNATSAPTPTATPSAPPSPPPTSMLNAFLADAVVLPSGSIDAAGVNATAVANPPPNGPPLIGGTPEQIAAVLKEHIAELEKDIARKEAAGQHDEAERERKSLQRLKGELDVILDGGPP